MVITLSLRRLSNIYAQLVTTVQALIESLENAQLDTTLAMVGCRVLNVLLAIYVQAV